MLDGVAPHMPSLALAQKLLGRAAPIGVTRAPAGSAAPGSAAPGSEAELGEALLGLVALARAHGWDADRALRGAIRRLEAEVRDAETTKLR